MQCCRESEDCEEGAVKGSNLPLPIPFKLSTSVPLPPFPQLSTKQLSHHHLLCFHLDCHFSSCFAYLHWHDYFLHPFCHVCRDLPISWCWKIIGKPEEMNLWGWDQSIDIVAMEWWYDSLVFYAHIMALFVILLRFIRHSDHATVSAKTCILCLSLQLSYNLSHTLVYNSDLQFKQSCILGSVWRSGSSNQKKTKVELNWIAVWSFLWLQLP